MQQAGGMGDVFDLPGDLVPGRYRLTKLLGRGGMGEVYLGADLRLKRDVAIKLLSRDKSTDAEARRRLLLEAQAAATLDHPHICPVYDSGETTDGRAYVVMQYVEGRTLAETLSQREMPPDQALRVATHVAEALSAAHARGLVHRDVKPANIIVTPAGQTKLLDLGIAKVVSFPAQDADAPTASAVTAEGMFIGTPPYMSPEQILQRPLDGRSDLFSLGTVLYECLTGRLAFAGQTHVETMANVLHTVPLAPSVVKPSLTARYDPVCEKLLQKDPEKRYQSAQELIEGIREISPSRHSWRGWLPRMSPRYLLASAAIVLVALSLWLWNRPRGLAPVPPDAARWYERGTEAIREGAYVTGRTALEQSIALFPGHVLAYARLAEADAELDDERSAQQRLVQLASLVPDESVLPGLERLRLRAVRALVLRDVDTSEAAYAEIVKSRPDEAGAWLDVGRVQESSGRLIDARASYEQAVKRDGQYAPAHLRLGYVLGQEGRRDEAMKAFAEAERLYRAASYAEGETEVLIRRGMMLDTLGEFKAARIDLERALALATSAGRIHQQVRTRAALSSVTASEGRIAEAEKIASTAVSEAIANGLETVAANGLIDLAIILQRDRPDDAGAQLTRALELANRRGARRTVIRGRLQQASLKIDLDKPRDALALVDEVLPAVQKGRYRGYELTARSVAARAHQDLGELDLARQMSKDTLEIAKAIKDEAQEAVAAASLSGVSALMGELPDALRAREQVVAIRRRQGDQGALPYDLANQAELLIRLGRNADAAKVLDELDAGAAAGLEGYVGRRRRVAYIRGLSATTLLRCDEALASFERVARFGPSTETAAMMTPIVASLCRARVGPRERGMTLPADMSAVFAREAGYWLAAAALERGDAAAAHEEASRALRSLGNATNNELRWRLEAVVAAAARSQGSTEGEGSSERAQVAINGIRSAWQEGFSQYGSRPDLTALRKRAGVQ
jgi:tetratricopeptide (TPR) repeat protein/predicted Ser/Thr protein kinase